MHQNTTFYAELNGEHVGEGFMPLRSINLERYGLVKLKNHGISEKLTFDLS